MVRAGVGRLQVFLVVPDCGLRSGLGFTYMSNVLITSPPRFRLDLFMKAMFPRPHRMRYPSLRLRRWPNLPHPCLSPPPPATAAVMAARVSHAVLVARQVRQPYQLLAACLFGCSCGCRTWDLHASTKSSVQSHRPSLPLGLVDEGDVPARAPDGAPVAPSATVAEPTTPVPEPAPAGDSSGDSGGDDGRLWNTEYSFRMCAASPTPPLVS